MSDNKIGELSATEEKVLNIWNNCAVFDIDDISLEDNFFEIGGNSVCAIKTIVKIKEVFGIDISSKTFFNNATIRSLSKIIDNLKSVHETKDDDKLENDERDSFEL